MSGEPPEHDRDQQTSSASNSVRRYVPIAPTDHHPRVDPQLVFIPIAVSSVGGPQVTSNSMKQSKAGANGVAPHKKKKERGSPTGKNVVVLKPCDVIVRDGTVFMPNTIEMAKLKKVEKGQFKTNVQISSRMTDKDIKRIIVETFPFLECQRFYCAAAVDERTRLDFHGERRIWDGRLIKQKIKGNSVLYIFAEENHPTVAGQLSVHDVTASSLPTETRTARDTTPMSSAQQRTTTGVLKHKNKSPAARINPYARPPQLSQRTPGSKKDNSIHQIKRPLPILLGTTLFAQNNMNNISTSPDQISLGSPCFTADATTSLLSVQMNNLGITSGTPLQPETSHVQKFTEPQRVHDVENSHGVSRDRPRPTSLQSSSMVRSIDRPKQTTDVSRQGTEESVYTNLTGKQLEPKLVRASASNHEVESLMCTTPNSISGTCADSLEPLMHTEPDVTLLYRLLEGNHLPPEMENEGPLRIPQMSEKSETLESQQGQVPDWHGNISDPSSSGIGSSSGPTSSGISNSSDHTSTETSDFDSDLNFSEQSSAMDQLIPMADIQSKVSMFPREVDLSGGYFCRFEFTPELLPELHSGHAAVGNLGTINLTKEGKHLVGYYIPPSDKPGLQPVTIFSHSGELLGKTELNYRKKPEPEFKEILERIAKEVNQDPTKMGLVLSLLANCCGGHGTNSSGETQNYGRFGSTETVQVLLTLLYKAAECGAQLFIKMILNSSAGRVIFREYKDSVPLPEVIARNHGHENTALYLEEINSRFSKDPTPEDPKRVLDWPEFLAAINSPQDESSDASEDESPQPDVRNDSDSSYLGDVESLSCDSAEPSSDSEGDLSEMFSKVNVSIKKKKQGLSLGCPKDVSPTVVNKKLQVQDNRTPFDSDDEMHSTDAHRDEKEEENDPRVEKNDSTNERESADDHKNGKKGDDHSTTTQAILAQALFDNLADALLRKGDFITVLEQDVDRLIDWWLCSLQGRQGSAPGNRMQQIKRRVDEHTSPEPIVSSEVFTFEDIDYDVPRPQEGQDYAVPRGIRSPDYDVPNADSQESNFANGTSPAFDLSSKQHGTENIVDNYTASAEVYDVRPALLEDDIQGDIYDTTSKSADQEPQNPTVLPKVSPSPFEENLRGQNDKKQQSVICNEPDLYSEIYDVPVISGDGDKIYGIDKITKGVNLSLDVTKNPTLRETKNRPAKAGNVVARLSGNSSDGKRQSSSSADNVKLSSEDDDHVDYQDIYGDGREQEVNVYDVPVLPISLQGEGQSFNGAPTPKRTQISFLRRINMSAVKELKLDPSAVLQRLAKLEQAVNVTVSKLLSFVTTSWRNPNILKPLLADIRDVARKAKVALRLLTEFGLSSLVNARKLPSQELSRRLSRAIEPLLETYYSVELALQRLDGQDWRLPLDKTDNTHDDLDLIMVHIRPVPENTQALAAIVRSAATTLYNLPAKGSRDNQATKKSVVLIISEESKTHTPKKENISGPEKSSENSNEEKQITLIKSVIKDVVDTNFKPRSNGGKWSPTTVRRVCGMDTPERDSASGSDENVAPNLPLRLQTSNEKLKSTSSEDEVKSSPPPPPETRDSSEKCQHLRQKSIDKFPFGTTGGPPPKPKLDRKNTTRKSYKIPLFTDHNRDNEDILRRERNESESEPTGTRRKCNSDPTQLLEQNKEVAEGRRMTLSSDKNKVVSLMKQTTVHVSDSDLPQSLRQSKSAHSFTSQSGEKVNFGFPKFDALQHRPLSDLIKGDGTSNGVMVSLIDRELLEFYKFEIDAQLFVLSEAVKSFFAVVEKAESPKVFVSNSKFVVLSAYKFVYIGDTLGKRSKHSELRGHVMSVTNKLSNCIKILVSATKSAALQYPASNAIKEMSDAVVVVNDVAVELYQIVKKTTKA